MRIHYFQHVPFEGLAGLETALRERGAKLSSTHWYRGERAPALSDMDALIVLGGPMSVGEESQYPWLREEKAFLRQWLADDRPTLGICLGAQLIADVLGAEVAPGPEREIGIWPIRCELAARESLSWSEEMTVFHWHGDACALPSGARLLASSPACAVQAFAWGQRVLALQFHLETTAASAQALIQNCPDDLAPGPWVNSAEEIGHALPKHAPSMQQAMREVLDRLLRTVES